MILQRYTLRGLIAPFFLGFSVVTFLLVIDFILDYLELILESGVPTFLVLKVFLLSLGWMFALSIPCGVLVGTLMTFGRMAQDNEILAMRSSGLSPARLLRPALIWGIGWTVFMLVFNHWILPRTNHEFSRLMTEIKKSKPTAKLGAGVFIDDFDGHQVMFDELDRETGRFRGITLLNFEDGRRLATTRAERGTLRYDRERDEMVLELNDGSAWAVPRDARDAGILRVSHFDRHRIVIGGEAESRSPRRHHRSMREMTIGQLAGEIQKHERDRVVLISTQDSTSQRAGYADFGELLAFGARSEPPTWIRQLMVGDPIPRPDPLDRHYVGPPELATLENAKMAERQIESLARREGQFRVEYHKKFSIAFACLIFVFVGAPLGLLARQGGVRAGFISVGFFLFYYLCLIGGEQLADRSLLRPWIAMWLANVVIGILAVVVTSKITYWRPWPRRGWGGP